VNLSPELAAIVLANASKVTAVNPAALEPTAAKPVAPVAKPSKMRNVRTEVNGVAFDSKKEAARWLVLLRRLQRGEIYFLKRQVPFRLEVNGVLICRYRADFTYIENGRRVVEDVKGMITPIYKLKRALMLAIHGIQIRET
jgi:hypothetical protein